MIVKLFSATILITVFISCSLGLPSTMKVKIDEGIIHKDLELELSNEKMPYTLVLELNEEVDCDLIIDVYKVREDGMFLNGSVDVLDLYNQEFQRDWYANKILVKARSLDSLSCKSLDLDLSIVYTILDLAAKD